MIFTTNSLDNVPPAFLSRLSAAIIKFKLPDLEQRITCFNFLLQKVTYDDEIDVKEIARACNKFSGRDIDHVITLAARKAKKAERDDIAKSDIIEAIAEIRKSKPSFMSSVKEFGKTVGPYIIPVAGLVLTAVGLCLSERSHNLQKKFHAEQMEHGRKQMDQAVKSHEEQKAQSDKQMSQAIKLNKDNMKFNLWIHRMNWLEQIYKDGFHHYIQTSGSDGSLVARALRSYKEDRQKANYFEADVEVAQLVAQDAREYAERNKSSVQNDDALIEQILKGVGSQGNSKDNEGQISTVLQKEIKS